MFTPGYFDRKVRAYEPLESIARVLDAACEFVERKETETMKHTSGPWEVSAAGTFIKLADNRAICRMYHGGIWEWATEVGSLDAAANAHRIVGCVNGCEGIKNPLAVGKLLEMCEAASKEIYHLMSELGDDPTKVGCYAQLQQAITAAKGGE